MARSRELLMNMTPQRGHGRLQLQSVTSAIIAMYAFAMPFDNIAFITGLHTLTYYLALIASIAIMLEGVCSSRRWLMRLSPSIGLVVLFTLWIFASTLWSVIPAQTLRAGITLGQLVLLHLLVSLRPWNEGSINGVVCSAAFGGLIAALVVIVLFYTGHTYQGTGRLSLVTTSGRLVDPNHFGASLIFPLVACAQKAVLGRRTVVTGACILLIGFALILTGSRGAIAGAVFGLAALLSMERIRLRSMILLGVGVTIIVAMYQLLPASLTSRFLVANIARAQSSGRWPIWQVCIAAFLERPIAGWGYATVSALTAGIAHGVPTGLAQAGHEAHNIYLQVASELGLVGLGLVTGFWVMNIVRAYRNGQRVPVFRVIVGSLVGLHVTGATLGILHYKYFWLVQMLASVKLAGSRSSRTDCVGDYDALDDAGLSMNTEQL